MEEFDPAEQRSQLRENVPPDLQDAYDRIIAAGMKFMFDESTHQDAMQFLQQEGPMDEKLAAGIGFLIVNMVKQANGAMPGELIIPAGIDLILQAAEFAGKSGIAEVTVNDIASAIQKFVFMMAEKGGIKPEQVMGGISKLQQMVKEGGATEGAQAPEQQPASGGLLNPRSA